MIKQATISNVFQSGKPAAADVSAKNLYKSSQAAFKRHVKTRYVWAGYVLIGFNVFLALSYLLGINSYAAQGYEISSLQRKIDQLSDTNQQLTVQYSQAASLVSVQSGFESAKYVPVAQANYVQVQQFSRR